MTGNIALLLERFYSADIKDGYAALLELETISDESGALYPYTRRFAEMTLSEKYAERVRGFWLFCKQARWDADNKLDESIDMVLSVLRDPKPTAVRQALAALPELIKYKPDLREIVFDAARKINYAQYKESMQGLIFKDVQGLLASGEE